MPNKNNTTIKFVLNLNPHSNIQSIKLNPCESLKNKAGEIVAKVFEGHVPKQICYCDHCVDQDGNPCKLHVHKYYKVTLLHIPDGSKITCKIVIFQCSYKCPICGKIVTPPLPFRFLNMRVTQDLAVRVLDMARPNVTDRSIARELCISEKQVTKILDAWHSLRDSKEFRVEIDTRQLTDSSTDLSHNELNDNATMEHVSCASFTALRKAIQRLMSKQKEVLRGEECPWQQPSVIKTLSVDEVSRYGRDYVTISLSKEGDFIYFCKGRGSDTMEKFAQRSQGNVASDLMVAADMHAPYLKTLKKLFPSSTNTIDSFHLFSHLNEDVAKSLDLIAETVADVTLKKKLTNKKFQTMFCKKHLDAEEQKCIEQIGIEVPVVLQLRKIIDLVHQAYDNQDKSQMELLLTQALVICNELQNQEDILLKYRKAEDLASFVEKSCLATNSEQESPLITRKAQFNYPKNTGKSLYPIAHFGQMVVHHWESINNYAITHMGTSISEGYNNFFQSLKHAKFGIKNLVRFMNRLRLQASWNNQQPVQACMGLVGRLKDLSDWLVII